MMMAYRAFTSAALADGYSMSASAELWKKSTVRRTGYTCEVHESTLCVFYCHTC